MERDFYADRSIQQLFAHESSFPLAGVIAAVRNAVGVVGAAGGNPAIRIMALRRPGRNLNPKALPSVSLEGCATSQSGMKTMLSPVSPKILELSNSEAMAKTRKL